MVPHRTLAPRAARIPATARWGVAVETWRDANPSMMAAMTMAVAPPRTRVQLAAPPPRSSLKSSHPQKRPTRQLAFQSGKAMARPTSRMAKTVRVLATAQRAPARTAQTMRWGLRAMSVKTKPVPLTRVGMVQRATKTPITMQREMANGEKPAVTSLVGAAALPSHTPATRPQITPRAWRERRLSAGNLPGDTALIGFGFGFGAVAGRFTLSGLPLSVRRAGDRLQVQALWRESRNGYR